MAAVSWARFSLQRARCESAFWLPLHADLCRLDTDRSSKPLCCTDQIMNALDRDDPGHVSADLQQHPTGHYEDPDSCCVPSAMAVAQLPADYSHSFTV